MPEKALDREILEETGISIVDEDKELLFTIETQFDNYPNRVDGTLEQRVRQTTYYRLFLPEIKFAEQDLTDGEKLAKFSINLVAFADLPRIVDEHESENPRWPFFKEELKFVLNELDKQAEGDV